MEPWEHLISKQTLWVQELLDEVHVPDGFPNLFTIIDCFDKEGNLITVSDGSANFHDMSFVWVLVSPDGTFSAQGAGPCAGRGNSLQPEGAGILGVTVFLSLVLTFTSRTNLSLTCISDNQELINRMKEHKEYTFPFPNKTTKSKFDITEQIFRTTKAYNISSDYN